MLGGTNSNAMAAALYKTLDYDPIKDFVAVAAIATDSNALVVNPAVPARTIAELVCMRKPIPASSHPAPRSASFRFLRSSS